MKWITTYRKDDKLFRYSIEISENDLDDYSSILMEREEKQYAYGEYSFEVVFCRWEKRLHQEYSKYYCLNGAGVEKYKENTTLNNKGDNFYHSLYIRSRVFDDFSFAKTSGQYRMEIVGKNREDEAFKYLKRELDKYIREKRDPFIRTSTKKFLTKLEEKDAYPNYNLNHYHRTHCDIHLRQGA